MAMQLTGIFILLTYFAGLGEIVRADDCTREMVQAQKEIAEQDALTQNAQKAYDDCKKSIWCSGPVCLCDGSRKKMGQTFGEGTDLATKWMPTRLKCCARFEKEKGVRLFTAIVKECGATIGTEQKISCYDLGEACHSWSRGDKDIAKPVVDCRKLSGYDQERCLSGYFGKLSQAEIKNTTTGPIAPTAPAAR